MYLQVVSFLLSSVALCLAANSVETTTEPGTVDSMSESAILGTITACATGSVLIVLLPTMLYYKLIRKYFYSEVF